MTKMESQASAGTIFTEDPDFSAYEYRETLEKILLQLSSFGLALGQNDLFVCTFYDTRNINNTSGDGMFDENS